MDSDNQFFELFSESSGFYIRSGVIENGKDTGRDPFMRNFPQLIDVGIMGSCTNGANGLCMKSGIQCYQNGSQVRKPNMSFPDFKMIVDQCKGKSFQFALGGRGDVDQHEHCEEFLRYCRENGIVPNFTSSGSGFSRRIADICKAYVGAIAISWHNADYTFRAIEMLLRARIKTNIHFVLGSHTIDEAMYRLGNNGFPEGINAILFLLHKPVGLGSEQNVLRSDDARIKRFFEMVDAKNYNFKIGFDSCSCAGIINHTNGINLDSIDYCEGARYSCYIDAQMNMTPCSFVNDDASWFVSLNDYSIMDAWNSEVFNRFRRFLSDSCRSCTDRVYCGGGCPIVNQITLCDRKERKPYEDTH